MRGLGWTVSSPNPYTEAQCDGSQRQGLDGSGGWASALSLPREDTGPGGHLQTRKRPQQLLPVRSADRRLPASGSGERQVALFVSQSVAFRYGGPSWPR